MSENASKQNVRLRDLDRTDFTAWCHVAIAELGQWLLFRWDPDEVEDTFPDSLDWYHGVAHSIVLGLWAGDDREVFCRRIRNDRRLYGPAGCDNDSLDRMWSFVQAWLPLSLNRWWIDYIDTAERALPRTLNLVDDTELPPGFARADWVNATVELAERAIAEAGVTTLQSNQSTELLPTDVALAQMRARLDGIDSAIEIYRWSSPGRDLILRICQDEDLHVVSAVPLTDTIARARGHHLLREE